jgi:hypothetical protein
MSRIGPPAKSCDFHGLRQRIAAAIRASEAPASRAIFSASAAPTIATTSRATGAMARILSWVSFMSTPFWRVDKAGWLYRAHRRCKFQADPMHTKLKSQIRELSAPGPMVGSPQGAMRTRRLLIGPVLLLPSKAGFLRRLMRSRSRPAPSAADRAFDSRRYRKFNGGGRIATHIRLCARSLNGTTPRTAPAHPAPVAGAVTFDATTAGKNHMKLTTIALASVLTITSSMAFAQGADGAGGGGTSSSSVGSSTVTETTTGISNTTTGSSLGLSGGFSTGTYPTLVTPGGLLSSVPAPGAVISR